MNDFILDLLFPIPAVEKKVNLSCLTVDLTHYDSSIRETVTFQSYEVFCWIESSVIIHSWKYYNADGKDAGGGSGMNAGPDMHAFFSELA